MEALHDFLGVKRFPRRPCSGMAHAAPAQILDDSSHHIARRPDGECEGFATAQVQQCATSQPPAALEHAEWHRLQEFSPGGHRRRSWSPEGTTLVS